MIKQTKHRSMKKYGKHRGGWKICKLSSESHLALLVLAAKAGKTSKDFLDDLITEAAIKQLEKESDK